jgi:hypothetical protein
MNASQVPCAASASVASRRGVVVAQFAAAGGEDGDADERSEPQ